MSYLTEKLSKLRSFDRE